ncbi:type IV toxin-antitoxin system AbiEi family antitoxin domain-containing protein [Microbacterium sp. USHLN186]|uniref:type IV toxin-antitoxin system AbiEi family antitoxin domain-containing protein n=1 Tax=Microbacterium sp. USHLN186 TaxID=3081286 RepID=UPI0030185AAD
MKTPIAKWMSQHRGVAHSSQLRDAGYSAYEVRVAVDRGVIERVHRSWVVSAECSPARRAAASVSGRVTCVSATREHGLWTPETDGTAHVALPSSACRTKRQGVKAHWARGPLPVTRFTTDEPLLNVLFHTARCLELSAATAVWESALRGGAVTLSQLRRTHWGTPAAGQVLERVGALSDSGIETAFVAIARSCGVEVRQQVLIDGHLVDALIGDRLVVQLDGFEFHQDAKDRRRDLRQDARLALLGYTVLRFDYQQVMFDRRYVQETLLNAIAQGLHLARRR